MVWTINAGRSKSHYEEPAEDIELVFICPMCGQIMTVLRASTESEIIWDLLIDKENKDVEWIQKEVVDSETIAVQCLYCDNTFDDTPENLIVGFNNSKLYVPKEGYWGDHPEEVEKFCKKNNLQLIWVDNI